MTMPLELTADGVEVARAQHERQGHANIVSTYLPRLLRGSGDELNNDQSLQNVFSVSLL